MAGIVFAFFSFQVGSAFATIHKTIEDMKKPNGKCQKGIIYLFAFYGIKYHE